MSKFASFGTNEQRWGAFIDFKRYCLEVASHISQNGLPIVYFLQGIPEEFEQCPERALFSHLNYLFLVCDGTELKSRLNNKSKGWGLLDKNPNHLNDILQYNNHLKQIAQKSAFPVFNTSVLSIEEVSEQVSRLSYP